MAEPSSSSAAAKPPRRRVIVTADDFGLTPEINAGIIAAHTQGLVGSTALLMNGLATTEALALKAKHPSLEVGIHLGIVEGFCLTSNGKANSLTDELSYLGDGPSLCLHRSWPRFIKRYVLGRIRLGELEAELDLQLARMQAAVGSIPFANGTQHLHLLPGVTEVVVRLLRKYQVPSLRLPPRSLRLQGSTRRWLPNLALRLLGYRAGRLAKAGGLTAPDYFAGFDVCGRLDPATVCKLVAAMPEGTMELMTHPGYDCPYLRAQLPQGYEGFSWAGELAALVSPEAKAAVAERGVELIQFKDL